MKKVMKRAWEIAKEGQKKFGGKVKEYFAQALKMAWAIVKNSVEIGYQSLPGKNGKCFFVVNNVDGLEVSLLSEERNMNGVKYTKRHPINDYRTGTNKVTGQAIRLYDYAWHCGDIEIRLGSQVKVIANHI